MAFCFPKLATDSATINSCSHSLRAAYGDGRFVAVPGKSSVSAPRKWVADIYRFKDIGTERAVESRTPNIAQQSEPLEHS